MSSMIVCLTCRRHVGTESRFLCTLHVLLPQFCIQLGFMLIYMYAAICFNPTLVRYIYISYGFSRSFHVPITMLLCFVCCLFCHFFSSSSQALINLLLTGHAVSNVWDSSRTVSGLGENNNNNNKKNDDDNIDIGRAQ